MLSCSSGGKCKVGRKSQSVFIFICKFVFVYFWLRWVFLAALRLSLFAVSRDCSAVACIGSGTLQLSVVMADEVYLSYGTCGLPGSGLELISSPLTGQFLPTGPPGKPLHK